MAVQSGGCNELSATVESCSKWNFLMSQSNEVSNPTSKTVEADIDNSFSNTCGVSFDKEQHDRFITENDSTKKS